MQKDTLASVNRLSDDELVARLKALVEGEREVSAQLAAYLSELRKRGCTAEVMAPSCDRYELQFTMDTDTFEKLQLVKELLRDEIPSADEATILELALTALLEHLKN